ncbi:hypothetical protein KUTeg_008309 [Tegillarca granosa]|uniref:Uncharacterized protein n=1 Tax=Tegillarca granosa TaxID=220873 RepID=A0ABQ9F8U0_TEGGR|nr:hypothetical protein KUTeg_008309 [Tegillarca granosa]
MGRYTISVSTGDRKNAGTDAGVYIKLFDRNGGSTGTLELDNFFKNDFEKGQTDTFIIDNNPTFLEEISSIELWREDKGLADSWFVDSITAQCECSNDVFVFPIHRWIKENKHYIINLLDISLPQFDENGVLRSDALREKRKLYELEEKLPGLPMQVKVLPEDESFSFDYQWDITKQKIGLIATSKIVLLTSGRWDSVDDIRNVYTKEIFVEPRVIRDYDSDVTLGVTEEMLKPFLEGLSLQEALSRKRIFITDFEIMKDLPTREGYVVCAPIGLFFANNKDDLLPIAIQLYQDKANDNPVFLPSDPKYTWQMAKIRALEKLISPDGWINNTMNEGVAGLLELVKRAFADWKLNVQGTLPEDLKERGMLNEDGPVLKNYHFSEDALLLYNIPKNWQVIGKFSNGEMHYQVQFQTRNWGVPGENGKFQTLDDLIITLTCIVYTCSVGHAAANFQQYDMYGYPPAYPAYMAGRPPTNKDPLTEADIMNALPDKPTTLDIMIVTKILSTKGTKSLGDFEVQYIVDPQALKIVEEFKEDLKAAGKTIEQLNNERNRPYEYLVPENIPNAISI